MKKYSFIFLIILSTLLSSCSAINKFLAESEERDAKKISYYAPVVYQRPYEETGNTALVQTFENGKQNGPFEVHYLDGKLQIKGNYKDDKKDGVWKYYREDGTLEGKVTYKNDEANGKYESYFENGKTLYSDGTYINGKKNGIEKETLSTSWISKDTEPRVDQHLKMETKLDGKGNIIEETEIRIEIINEKTREYKENGIRKKTVITYEYYE